MQYLLFEFLLSFFYCFFLDDLDKELVSKSWLTYIPGKGDHLVPIIFPRDTHEALMYLINADARKEAGVCVTNKFVFPSTRNSERNCSGWHCVDNICKNLQLINRNKINATKNRHRVSTLYCTLELPPAEKKAFYDHMGHTGDMNEQRLVF